MKLIKQKVTAFTLIEILIVVSIILIIATIGIGAYSNARQSMAVDIEGDKIVATLHSFRNEAGSSNKCAVMVFEKGKTPKKMEAVYRNAIDGCGPASDAQFPAFDPEIIVSALTLGGAERNDFSVLFAPPHGAIQFIPSTTGTEGTITISPKGGSTKIRTISINSLSGKVEKN